MKITRTTTETTEIEISLPAFTKIKELYCTSYYFVENENKVSRIDKYTHSGIKSFSQIGNIKDAFSKNFEYITKQEYIDIHETLVDEVINELNQIKLDLAQLQTDVKTEKNK